MDDFSPEEKQRQANQEDGAGGDDGSTEDLVDTAVHHIRQGVPGAQPEVFPDPVVDHHGIGQRITGQGEKGGDQEEVYFFPEDEKDPEDDQNVVKSGDGRSDAEREFEAPGNINDHA